METASPAEEPSPRQRVVSLVLPQPSASTAGEDTDTKITEGEPLTVPIRKTLCDGGSGTQVRYYTGLCTM